VGSNGKAQVPRTTLQGPRKKQNENVDVVQSGWTDGSEKKEVKDDSSKGAHELNQTKDDFKRNPGKRPERKGGRGETPHLLMAVMSTRTMVRPT